LQRNQFVAALEDAELLFIAVSDIALDMVSLFQAPLQMQ
jgi:hypothetical protein